MARIRTIKPEFWQDEELSQCSTEARLLAIGLLNMADDEGYFKAHPALIRASVFPFDESLIIHGLLSELSNIEYIRLTVGSDGKSYGIVNNFTKHQKVNRPKPSIIGPLCQFHEPITDESLTNHGGVSVGKEQGTGNREQGMEQGTRDDERSGEWPPGWLDTEAWKRWLRYRREKGFRPSNTETRAQLDFLEQNRADHVAIIEQSIRSGWSSLQLLKSGKQTYGANFEENAAAGAAWVDKKRNQDPGIGIIDTEVINA